MVDEFILLRGKWGDSQGVQRLAQSESFGFKRVGDLQDSRSGLLGIFAHEAVGWPVSAIGWNRESGPKRRAWVSMGKPSNYLKVYAYECVEMATVEGDSLQNYTRFSKIHPMPPLLWLKAMARDILERISHRYQQIESEQLGSLTLIELTQPRLQLVNGGAEGVVSEAGTD